MGTVILLAALTFCARAANTNPTDTFERMKALAGEWDADLPGFGKMSDSIRLVSNGKAIEETLGTASDNEVSLYTRDGDRIVLTHFCALTSDGHQVRLETAPLAGVQGSIVFAFRDAINLHGHAAPHMRQVIMTFTDSAHFSEKWTKTENGKDTVFEIKFVRKEVTEPRP
jgi:hypothetical protein